jgi:hypothetical protein
MFEKPDTRKSDPKGKDRQLIKDGGFTEDVISDNLILEGRDRLQENTIRIKHILGVLESSGHPFPGFSDSLLDGATFPEVLEYVNKRVLGYDKYWNNLPAEINTKERGAISPDDLRNDLKEIIDQYKEGGNLPVELLFRKFNSEEEMPLWNTRVNSARDVIDFLKSTDYEPPVSASLVYSASPYSVLKGLYELEKDDSYWNNLPEKIKHTPLGERIGPDTTTRLKDDLRDQLRRIVDAYKL